MSRLFVICFVLGIAAAIAASVVLVPRAIQVQQEMSRAAVKRTLGCNDGLILASDTGAVCLENFEIR
jgi:hypothetical protein